MESSNRLLLLSSALCATLLLSGCSTLRWPWGNDKQVEQQQTDVEAAEEEAEEQDITPPRVIEPNVARRKIKTPKIDNENWEVGVGAGFVSIEDFGTNPAVAAQLTYHVTEDFFFRADLGQSTAGRTSFETLGGNIELLTGDERRFTYYSLSLGYNFLPGEVFLGRKLAMNSSFYLLGGIGSVEVRRRQPADAEFRRGLPRAADRLAGDLARSAGPRVRLRLVRRDQGHQQHGNAAQRDRLFLTE